MPYFALAVVPHDWNESMPLRFSQAEYERLRNEVESGTQIILFRGAPANEVIGQAQTQGVFVRTAEWPAENRGGIDPSDPDNAYLLPLDVLLILRGPVAPVPLARVHEVLRETTFPLPGERWRKISASEYDALRDGWI